MPRIRTIKPDFWSDEKIGSLPVQARLLFIGTWSFADDNGVVRGNPSYLKAQLFPYDDNLRVGELKRWIDALVEARMLIPLTYRGESYYVVRTFRSHQKIDARYSNELIPRGELGMLLERVGDTAGTRRAHVETSPVEVEVEREMDNSSSSPFAGVGMLTDDVGVGKEKSCAKRESGTDEGRVGVSQMASWLKSDTAWMETVSMNTGIGIGRLGECIDEFVANQSVCGVESKLRSDCKPHFINWLRKKQQHGTTKKSRRTDGESTNERIARECRERVEARLRHSSGEVGRDRGGVPL